MELQVQRFEAPDESRSFARGRFDLLRAGGVVLGRATYEPGWRWSEHVGPLTGLSSCHVEHVGIVVSGRAMVRMDDGREVEMRAGDVFSVPPGHDSWVVGEDTYVSIHLLGAEGYAKSDGYDVAREGGAR